MDSVQDLAAWVEQSDRELQQWLDGLEAEDNRLLTWLVDQADIDSMETLQ